MSQSASEWEILADLSFVDEDRSFEDWLARIGLPEVRDTLESHGWDNVDFMKGTIGRDDLNAMGIKDDKMKRALLTSIEEDLADFHNHSMPDTVEEWLEALNLSRYLNRFMSNRMGSLNRVMKIQESELTRIYDIQPIGHRRRIMSSIKDLRNLQHKDDEADKERRVSMTRWKRSQDDIRQGIYYWVGYYGCSQLEKSENSDETSRICTNQQNKFRKEMKVPIEINLKISSISIEMIDRQTLKATDVFRLKDISFVSRAKGNPLFFCFVNSDRKQGVKICHVFKAQSREVAYGACSNLSQAFEVGYNDQQPSKAAIANGK